MLKRIILLLCAVWIHVAFGLESHIVFLKTPDESISSPFRQVFHNTFLSNVLGSAYDEGAIFYHYSYGFAAQITAEQAEAVAKHPDVLAVLPNKQRVLHTTDSWRFLGLTAGDKQSLFGGHSSKTLWKEGHYGKDIIVGSMDTGIWPESESYSDAGLGPIPKKWRGFCESGDQFNSSFCNRKLIGARHFFKGQIAMGNNESIIRSQGEFLSARDASGHGTHTSSTAMGAFVPGANYFGYANGTSSGGAPHARLAAYKICWKNLDCQDADILAALEAAVEDGVDIITMSVGGGDIFDYWSDSISIGTFHAVKHGITVVCSAGNDGVRNISNVAPWIITVGASTIGRDYYGELLLGNMQNFTGTILNRHWDALARELHPLIAAESAALNTSDAAVTNARLCLPQSLNPVNVKGKIVACLRGDILRPVKGQIVLDAGGAGMILYNAPGGPTDLEYDDYPLPAIHIDSNAGEAVLIYINSTTNPVADFYPQTGLNANPSPRMASFSSRGPNPCTPDILKPDITAPGVSILASFSPVVFNGGFVGLNFTLLDGTSMACPHVAGTVALLKTIHPHWSPAAIKSAIVTTGYQFDNKNEEIEDYFPSYLMPEPATPFAFGGGHLHPNAASHPGLVYDAKDTDYRHFLCGLGYTEKQLAVFYPYSTVTCPEHAVEPVNLNYPSIAISNLTGTMTVKRRVTNLGNKGSTVYRVTIDAPEGIDVSVSPMELHFRHHGQTKTFHVKFNATQSTGNYVFGSLTWSNGKYSVRSPLAVFAH